MLKLIVPPPIELASRIAWRNEPVPLSFVFVTVKARGVVRLCGVVDEGDGERSPDCAVSCAERPNPTSAKQLPVRTIARPTKTCEPKKADCEMTFFLMRRRFYLTRAREVLKA